ncbi:MAG: CoB--CoM heterodisulfide reductase iron-sulfur subunit B family protein [Actinobacteria bacterium]|nr:CoB--CoM heterodisulfide reductase iron-sulfur subunit B family protein [Actinomycetota bacterium]
MRYSFYPGCEMEGAAVPYLKSFEAVAHVLGIELKEIPDWNCCGATVASGVIGDYPAQVMSARNLALAEPEGADIIVPCSSCYMNLAITNRKFKEDGHFRQMANEALGEVGLKYNGSLNVRQVIDVMVNDVTLDGIKAKVKKPLTGLRVAGYVGCQTPRVFPWEFDDPEQPVFFDKIIEAMGATPVKFPMKARCCGSSHNLTRTEIVTEACYNIITSALDDQAHIMVTPCPMCQMNLDAYQGKVKQHHKLNTSMPVLFFTQLMAIAFDLPPEAWALKHNIVSPYTALAKFGVSK